MLTKDINEMNNLYIGDNLFVLKDLANDNMNYKMIYIDPPYNTKTKKNI